MPQGGEGSKRGPRGSIKGLRLRRGLWANKLGDSAAGRAIAEAQQAPSEAKVGTGAACPSVGAHEEAQAVARRMLGQTDMRCQFKHLENLRKRNAENQAVCV